jgi:hypothetical protein
MDRDAALHANGRTRESRVRKRLAAGGRWIRTSGTWREGAGFCCGKRMRGIEPEAPSAPDSPLEETRFELPVPLLRTVCRILSNEGRSVPPSSAKNGECAGARAFEMIDLVQKLAAWLTSRRRVPDTERYTCRTHMITPGSAQSPACCPHETDYGRQRRAAVDQARAFSQQ